jgi:hypothetical protein
MSFPQFGFPRLRALVGTMDGLTTARMILRPGKNGPTVGWANGISRMKLSGILHPGQPGF